ncbi:MAG TPA: hypothetical protein VFY13_08565, partial [Luteolibacter sp.]|nr:hypothetical protein [Luteolibacter sp.]
KDKDPRVRQAGCQAISARTAPAVKYGPPQADRLTDEMAQLLIGMINDPNESLWVVHHALNALGVARAELLAPHLDRLCYWLLHEEWWMRKGALAAVSNMAVDERYCQKLIPVMGKMITSNRNALMMWQLWGLCGRMREASPTVQAMAKDMLAKAYGEFPEKIVANGGLSLDHAQSMMFENIAGSLASHPGGLDVLAELSSKRFPNKTLAHKDLFMNADASQLAAATKQKVNMIIQDQFIPEYIADNILNFLDVRQEPVVTDRGQQTKLEGLATLYTKMGVNDYTWHEFGPKWTDMKWDYITFDPPETLSWKPGEWRYRKVTCPAGMENWFATDFDAKKAGWKSGLQPIGQENDKLRTEPKPFIDQLMNRPESEKKPCTTPHCRCCEPMKTFWEKEVLLMRGTFSIPPLKVGHRYRLVIGGMSCINTGDGVRVYVNGEEVYESKTGGLKAPACFYVDEKHLSKFQSGTVTIAVTGFLKIHKRSSNKGNQIAVWLEEMKLPPLDDSMIRKAAMTKPLLSSAWQAMQDPEQPSEDPEAGKFKWDGKFVANPAVVGTWKSVALVPAIEAFDPANPASSGRPPFTEITFKEGGHTDKRHWFWTGDAFIPLDAGQVLKMTVKGDYLFVEAGGFSAKNPSGWKSPLVVMKKM